MTEPWLKDACSLVDAFRAKTLSPTEALEASMAANEASDLNAFSLVDAEAARAQAAAADLSLPFGGVPIGVKELEPVDGWPYTEASLVFADRMSEGDSTHVTRLRAAGAAVAGGLLPIATGGDGGGSIRIPAGFTGLFGLKSTYGRFPRGPRTLQPPLTVTLGCVSRSVRDTARWFDVCSGFDARDTLSLPRVSGWEAGLGSFDLSGKRAVVSVDLGAAIVEPRAAALVVEAAEALIRDAGLKHVDVVVQLPQGGLEWALSNLVG